MTSHTRPSTGVSNIDPPCITTLSVGMILQTKFRCVWPGQNALDQSAVVSCAWEFILLFAVVPLLVRPVHTFHFRRVIHWTYKIWWPLVSDSKSGRNMLTGPVRFSARPGKKHGALPVLLSSNIFSTDKCSTVGYATANTCYNECGWILLADVAQACSWCVGPTLFN
jgi:hypothetical protein